MDISRNSFKAALGAGKVQLGIWSCLCSPLVSELLAQSGFDWILFDGEHSPVEMADLLPLLQAASGGTASLAVRPPWNDRVLIKKVLDLGAQTVLVPFVETAEEARDAARACWYPPAGVRGVASATRAGGFGRIADYFHKANDEMCVLVQVETAGALARLDEIARADGVDGVFIGPSDLAASMGHLGNPGHGEVQEAIREAAGAIRKAGKAPGILATSAADAQKYVDWGYLFVACSLDVRILATGLDGLLRDMGR